MRGAGVRCAAPTQGSRDAHHDVSSAFKVRSTCGGAVVRSPRGCYQHFEGPAQSKLGESPAAMSEVGLHVGRG